VDPSAGRPVAVGDVLLEADEVAPAEDHEIDVTDVVGQADERSDVVRPRSLRLLVVGVADDLDVPETGSQLMLGGEWEQEIAQVWDVERPTHRDATRGHASPNRNESCRE
jgi:hypothetical protein